MANRNIILIIVCLALVACPLQEEIDLVNTSLVAASVTLADGSHRKWPAGSTFTISDRGENGITWESMQWRNDSNGNSYPVLVIDCGNTTNSYNMSIIYRRDGYSRKDGNTVRYKMQLEQDCRLYLLAAQLGTNASATSKKQLLKPESR